MNDWKEVCTKQDIDELMDFCSGFHDSCIAGINYQSGTLVDEDNGMRFGDADDYCASVIFHSQCCKSTELCFGGVRRMHIVGKQDNFTNDIFDAFLDFCEDILPSEFLNKRSIIWADSADFNINALDGKLKEPDDTYIIAASLKWRVTE